MQEWWKIVAVVLGLAITIFLLLLVVGLIQDRRSASGRHAKPRPSRDSFRATPAPQRRKQAAVIVNPMKVADADAFTKAVNAVMSRHDWEAPLVLNTSAEDPGPGQARQALAAGVDVVCVLGGDGTVRAVAQELAGGHTPMGLLPGGTGNLLARNLSLPLASLDAALEVALNGRNRHIDVGWLTIDPEPEVEPEAAAAAEVEAPADSPSDGTSSQVRTTPDTVVESALPVVEPLRRHAFLVMAGLGFDADIMDSTSEELKAKVGWPAYASGAMRRLLTERFKAKVRIDGGDVETFRARTIVAGNCGRLTGGITLMPDAQVDDGVFDFVVLHPKGIAGWAGVATHVIARRESNHSRLERYRGSRALVTVDRPQLVQADGDVLGDATSLLIEMAPRSLIVRAGASN